MPDQDYYDLPLRLTDGEGLPAVPEAEMYEPAKGSVIVVHGLTGAAWQRHHRDGLWHCTVPGRRQRTWAEVSRWRNVWLVHDTTEEESREARTTQ